MAEKNDPLWELECAEANLSDDIQALVYIQDDLETTKKTEMLLAIPEISNKIQILLKSMIYNRENMQRVLNQHYKEVDETPKQEVKRKIYTENGVKHIRMGWEYDYVKGVILSDGTIIQNMQCSLDAKVPTDEELIAIDDKNNKSREEKENA